MRSYAWCVVLDFGSLLASALPSRSPSVGSATTTSSGEPADRDADRLALHEARPAVPHALAARSSWRRPTVKRSMVNPTKPSSAGSSVIAAEHRDDDGQRRARPRGRAGS